ncbi:MAG: DUF2202 domain-containing protein [Myxococcales bacterium]|nr:DUF2202 domain-containing protein [Myxococcales bacterium]
MRTALTAVLGLLITASAAGACPQDDVAVAPAATPLDADAQRGLVQMREEEKLARDVYQANARRYGLPIFGHIAGSEQRHLETVGGLLQARGLPDPTAGKAPGQFASPTMQALFDRLDARSATSLEEALRVGAEIEELDIRDLTQALERTQAEDLRAVYGHLIAASHNHLRAYTRQLDRRGITYVPAHLPRARFDAIVAAEGPGHGGACGGGECGCGGGRDD